MKHKQTLYWIIAALLANILALMMFVSEVRADPPVSWYVSPTGVDDAGCGASTSSCLTISHAISEALPNTTIILTPGTYTQTSTLTLTKTITLTSRDGTGSAVIAGESIDNVILIENDNVTLSALEVQNSTAAAIRQSDAYTSTTISDTTIHTCGDACVQLKACTHCLIKNSEIFDILSPMRAQAL
jgi:hypothetical protein